MDRGHNGHSSSGRSDGNHKSAHNKLEQSADKMLHGLENISMLIPEDHAALHLEAQTKISESRAAENRQIVNQSQQSKPAPITSAEINTIKTVEKTSKVTPPVIAPAVTEFIFNPKVQQDLERIVNSHLNDDMQDQSNRFRLLLDEEILIKPVMKKVVKQITEEIKPVSLPPQQEMTLVKETVRKEPIRKKEKEVVKEAFYEQTEQDATPRDHADYDGMTLLERKFKNVASILDTRKIKAEIPGLDEPISSFTRWWQDKVALAYPVNEAARIGSAFIFNRENEEQNYYFIPYPMEQALRNSLPEEWRDFDAETAWGVATVAGCTGVILTFWLLLYWMTPERRYIIRNNQGLENDESIASAILNITSPTPEVESHVIIRDVQKPVINNPVPPPQDNPFFNEIKKPVSFGTPEINIFRERTIYGQAVNPQLNENTYVWSARSKYVPQDSELISLFTGNNWSIAQYIPGRFSSAGSAFHASPLISRWSKSLASASLVAFKNEPIEINDFHQIPSTGYINPDIKLTQPKLTPSGVYQTRLKVENQSHLTPIEVVVRAGNSDMWNLVETSPGLKEVSESGLRWHAKALYPNMVNEYRLFQVTNSRQPLTRSYYQVEVSSQVASITRVGNHGVTLDLVASSNANEGDYVTLEFNISNRTPFPIRNSLLKVQLPEIVEHLKGNIIERDISDLASGERKHFSLTVLAKDIGVRPVHATLMQSNQQLAQDREVLTIHKGNGSGIVRKPLPPIQEKPSSVVSTKPISQSQYYPSSENTTTYSGNSCGCFSTAPPAQIGSDYFFEYR